MNYKTLISLASVAALTACSTMGKLMVTGLVETSTYMPGVITSRSDLDDYLKVVRPVSGRVVSDKIGTYYHQDKGDQMHIVLLRKDDELVLRGAMTSTVGLMEPVYAYDTNARVGPDWVATQARHDFLVKGLRLKLLPMEATRKFHDLLARFAATELVRTASAATTVSVAFSGNDGLYNNQFGKQVMDQVPGGAQYIVMDAMTEHYFKSIRNVSARTSGTLNDVDMALMSLRTLRYQSMTFMTRPYLASLEKGGSLRFPSRCYALDLPNMRATLDFSIADAYASRPKNAAEEAVALRTRKVELASEISTYQKARLDSERHCQIGLQAMQVAGAIESAPLR